MAHHDLRPGQVLGDRYRLDRALGSGRIGTVYAAEDLLLARPVAIKVVDPEFAEGPEASAAIRRAGSLMASTSHAGLVTVYDATQLGDHFCIVMEFVPGPNLAELIEDGGVSPQLAARIGHQAAAALDKVHSLGHVHGSVTASNILVTPHGSAKLADLGLDLDDPAADDSNDADADVRHLATALRRAVAQPAAKDAADLVDVLDAAARSNGQRWNASQLADALDVLAGNGDPGAIATGPEDPDATAIIDTVPSDPAPESDAGATQILPAPGLDALPATEEMLAGSTAGHQDVRVAPAQAQRPRAAWLGRAALAVAVLAVVAVVVSRGGSPNGGDDGGTGGTEGAQPVAIQGASDFDPLGGGGEHSDEVPAAYDGDPATAWTTERYDQANLGGLKAGVGIWFDLGETVDVGRLELTMAVAGVDYAVYALDTAPEGGDPGAWGEPVATASQAEPSQAIDVPDGRQARYWLVWMTNLGPDDGRFRGGVAEIAFVAR